MFQNQEWNFKFKECPEYLVVVIIEDFLISYPLDPFCD